MAKDKDKDDFTTDLIKSLNKEMGDRIAYNLATDIDAPTIVKRWISTGSIQLDYLISNRRNGGVPEGRIIEIYGPPAIGKSHLALQITKNTQRMGGMVIYIDSENATNVELLGQLGVDVKKRFVYVEEKCTEDVFTIMEKAIIRAKEIDKDVPVVIVWDSVAACSPKAELLGEYDKETIGLQARSLAKGFRKITSTIGAERVTLICLNQMKTKIGVLYGDPDTTPGGQAIPFHASVRLKLTSGVQIKGTGEHNKDEVVGIKVIATSVKNKVASPRRKCEFEIHFGIGIKESEEIFNHINRVGEITTEEGLKVVCGGNGTWKEFKVTGPDGKALHSLKFYKADFESKLFNNSTYRPFIDELMDRAFIKRYDVPTIMSELEAEEDMMNESLHDRQNPVEGVTGA
jgi:recombination protein RecA